MVISAMPSEVPLRAAGGRCHIVAGAQAVTVGRGVEAATPRPARFRMDTPPALPHRSRGASAATARLAEAQGLEAGTTQTRARAIGPLLGVGLVAGNMLGAGVYTLPASLGAIGSISILGWLVAIFGAACIAGVFSCLAIIRPGGEGLFDYIGDAFGRGPGFIVGVLYWCPLSCVPLAVGLTGYVGFFAPALAHGMAGTITTIAFIWLFVGANIVGARFVSQLGGLTLVIGAAPLLLVGGLGATQFHPEIFAASWNVSGHPAAAVIPQATVNALYAFLGLEAAAVIAPLMRNPVRDVPIATFGGLAIAAVIYLAACGVIMGVLPASALAKSTSPFADVGVPLFGASIAAVIAVCTLAKVSGSLAGNILSIAETADSPAVLGRFVKNRRHGGRPSLANLLVIGVLMSLTVVASASPNLGRQFTILINITVVLSLLAYLAACLALLRFSGGAPAGLRLKARVAALAGALFCVWAIAVSERDLLVWSAGAIGVAILAWLAVRRRALATA